MRSIYVALPPEAIDGQGGELEMGYETHLYMARRLDPDQVLRT